MIVFIHEQLHAVQTIFLEADLERVPHHGCADSVPAQTRLADENLPDVAKIVCPVEDDMDEAQRLAGFGCGFEAEVGDFAVLVLG